MKPHMLKPIMRTDLIPAQRMLSLACRFSRAHTQAAQRACQRYGAHGSVISGSVREHFPDHVRDGLRVLALRCSHAVECAWLLKPKRIWATTMRELSAQVARREGSGFYGPQG